jgi:NAD(P)-dependent dehydrogenase (short-subunit alcohol dehydrogenase family)
VSHVSQLVRDAGGDALPLTVDVRDTEALAQLVDPVLQRFGRLDHVIYCAGHQPDAAFVWDLDLEQVQAAFDVNVLGPVLIARQVVPIMLEQGDGTLVFVTSALPAWPIPGLGAYSASRAAENILARTLAAEVRGSGMRVHVVTPPPTATSALRRFRAALPGQRAEADRDTGEDPAHVAESIVRLCLPAWQWTAGRTQSGAERDRSFPGTQRRFGRTPW